MSESIARSKLRSLVNEIMSLMGLGNWSYIIVDSRIQDLSEDQINDIWLIIKRGV